MQKNNKNFYQLFLYYTQVIIIPVILLSIILMSILFSKLADSYKKSNLNVLEQSAKLIDSGMNSVLTMSYQLAASEDIRNIVENSFENVSKRNFHAWKASKEMELFQTNSVFFDNIGVYSARNDIVIEKNITYTTREYYERYLIGETIGYEEFIDKLNQNYSDFFVSSSPQSGQGGGLSIFCRSIRLSNSMERAVLLLAIDENQIASLLSKMGVADESGIAILDRSGNVAFSSIPFAGKKDENGVYIRKGYIVVPKKSDIFNFQYLYFIPKNELYGNAWILFAIVLFCMIGAVVSGGLLAKKYAKRAKEATFALLDESRRLSENLDLQIADARERLLINLLKNNATNDMLQLSKNYNMCFDGTQFCVIVLGVSEFPEIEFDAYSEAVSQACQNVKEIVCGIFNEKNIVNYPVRFHAGGYIFVLNYDDESALTESISRLKQILHENNNVICVGVGEAVSELSHVRTSYSGAMSAFYDSIHGRSSDTVVYYKDIKDLSDSKLYYALEQENAIVRCVKTGACEELEQVLDEIHRVNFLERQNPYHVLNRLIFNMVHTTYKILDETYAEDAEKLEQGDRVCKNVMNHEDVEKGFDILREVLLSICRHWQSRSSSNETKEAVIAYINKNYANRDLSLDMVADHVNMSYYYLSRLFKDYIGTSFVSYLTMIRLEESKKLLDNSNEKVENIADRVGFNGSNSYIKAFKKYCGITPGVYRKRDSK